MNYLQTEGEWDLYKIPSTQFLRLYGLSPYPVRQKVDKHVAQLEELAEGMGRALRRSL